MEDTRLEEQGRISIERRTHSSLQPFRSSDSGENWTKDPLVPLDGYPLELELVTTRDGMRAFVNTYETTTATYHDRVWSTWSRLTGLKLMTGYGRGHYLAAVGGDVVRMAWADTRRAHGPTWPLIFNPPWPNNDVCIGDLSTGSSDAVAHVARLTPYLSHASDLRMQSLHDGVVLLMWSGRVRVGETVMAGHQPAEIFYTVVRP